jgi:flagellar hook-associated protein 2
LKTQFANLETALGKLKDQSSWLSGQLAGLPTGSK